MSFGKGWPNKFLGDHGAYAYCFRSGIKSNLDDMIWEQGMLVSPEFSDTVTGGNFGLLGSRDADIARHISQDTSDLQPHRKLSEPNEPDEDVDFF
jgi:hypothetical protein